MGAALIALSLVSAFAVALAGPAVAAGPTAPQNVGTLVSGTSVTIAWSPPASNGGSPINLYKVTAHDSSAGAAPWGTEFGCGSCTSVVWPNLVAGHLYTFTVVARNAQAFSPAAAITTAQVPAGPCIGSGVCTTADATNLGPRINLVAQGLNGWQTYVAGLTDLNRLLALKVQNWRSPQQLVAASDWSVASSQTPDLTFCCLHQEWQMDHKNWAFLPLTNAYLYTRSPWDNWAGFDYWVSTFLSKVKAANDLPAYWDLMNECESYQSSNPTMGCYYHSSAYGMAPTLTLVELELQHMYTDIRAFYSANNLGTPRFVVPSLAGFASEPAAAGVPSPHLPIPLDQFLSWSDAVGIHWDAVSWHEIQDEGYFDYSNESIPTHVQQIRSVVANHPSLSGLQVFVSENGAQTTFWHAGWEAGRIWALETAGVDEGSRTCWVDPDHNAQTECYDGSLDGLLSMNGAGQETLPRSVWWVNCEYAQMQSAAQIPTTTSDHSIRTLAGFQSASNEIQLLMGRHVGTWITAPATPVTFQVTLPSTMSSPNVFVQRIPDSGTSPEASLPAVTSLTPTINGNLLAVTVPLVLDNDAYMITITPATAVTDSCRAVS